MHQGTVGERAKRERERGRKKKNKKGGERGRERKRKKEKEGQGDEERESDGAFKCVKISGGRFIYFTSNLFVNQETSKQTGNALKLL